MDIWIIQDGEKTGPVHDFEIRRKIESGDLSADTPAWHEGLAEWTSLGKIALFEHEFELPFETTDAPATQDPREESQPANPKPPLPTEKPALIRRFWARWFDLYLFAGFWWITMWAVGRDIEATLQNAWIILFQYIPWFIMETFLLHRFGTTPGKWLLGLRVTNNDGSLLTLSGATQRSMRVLCLGIGFGWGILPIVCQTMAFFTTKRLGQTLWDKAGGHCVTTAPLHPLRLTALVFLFFAAIQLQMIVVSPYIIEATIKTFPSLKEQFEENPPWHLPKNSKS
jgi:uncharacterized RDD family membrane protein YckC